MSEQLPIPNTERLRRLAEAWSRSPKPTPHPIGPGQESVWNYPRPPAVERTSARIQLFIDDQRIVDAASCLRVLETASPPTIYVHKDTIAADVLVPDSGSSRCEWKGTATYYAANSEAGLIRQLAWTYPTPLDEYAVLKDHVSFYPGRVTRCLYNDEQVRPQPGAFYAGWITDNIVGPFKGDPGSSGW